MEFRAVENQESCSEAKRGAAGFDIGFQSGRKIG
jgi:hypothetical protein